MGFITGVGVVDGVVVDGVAATAAGAGLDAETGGATAAGAGLDAEGIIAIGKSPIKL